MDYHNIPYVPIETNPISKKEVKQDAILLEGVLVVVDGVGERQAALAHNALVWWR